MLVLSVGGRGLDVGGKILRLLLWRGEGEETLFLGRVVMIALDGCVAVRVSGLDEDEEQSCKDDDDGDDDACQ